MSSIVRPSVDALIQPVQDRQMQYGVELRCPIWHPFRCVETEFAVEVEASTTLDVMASDLMSLQFMSHLDHELLFVTRLARKESEATEGLAMSFLRQ